MKSDFLWVEKYRPKTVQDCILPDSIKNTFQEFVKKGEIPNLLLAGPAGCGKTTIARALCEQLGSDYIVINGSDEGRFLDTVRNQAKNFASTVSLAATGTHKVIIIDEADNTTHDVQLLLRANIEAFSTTAGSYLPATIRTKSLNPYTPDAPSLSFLSQENRNPQSLLLSSNDLTISWTVNGLKLIRKSSQNLSTNTSQTGEEF